MKKYDYLKDTSFHREIKSRIELSKIGIEKESFRFSNSGISRLPHPKSLGSALCNKFITTDFAESQLEFVTNPYENHKDVLNFLDNIHIFVHERLNDELLWPLSMPPYVQSERDINIAEYGLSNTAQLKMTYRNGLSSRYGRIMQAISGIHFNYSLDPEIIDIIINREKSSKVNISKSDIYFRTIRNLTRLNWFIIYLFGSSPALNKNFIENNGSGYKKINDIFFTEDATSLRMSDIGYYVVDQQKLEISLNTLKEYLNSLKRYTTLVNRKYKHTQKFDNNLESQISSAFLQIEDEYYANVRPKSSLMSGKRMIHKLKTTGVDYIEMRTLDVNPFKKAGIGIDDTKFLEAFMIFCTFLNSPEMTFDEIQIARENDLKVSTHGRKENLKLIKKGKEITLQNWAREIFEDMAPIFDLLSLSKRLLREYEMRINNSEHTPSAKLVKLIKNHGGDYNDLGTKIAFLHKSEYMQQTKKNQNTQTLLSNETTRSLREQKELESSYDESFSGYLSKYLDG